MTETARNSILSKLRSAQNSPAFEPSLYSVLEEKKWSPSERIQKFKQVTEAVNTQVFETTSKTWLNDLKALLEEKNISELMYGPATDLALEIEQSWGKTQTKLALYNDAIESCKEKLFSVEAAITTSLGAIAETGSLIILPTKEEPRLLSLTPPIHIAIVKADRFFNTFYEALETENFADHMPTNLLLISGPSKTADIEQELCYGVHGPKELFIFIVH
jgi:L-lactate dehydrogenase complex protein LldG